MSKRKGLSSDCKLPPEIALAIQMEGVEHPCDRCNENRDICRGYPRGSSHKREIDFISIMLRPDIDGRYYKDAKVFQTDITVNGKRYGLQEIFIDDMIKSDFDRLWESIGRKLKELIK